LKKTRDVYRLIDEDRKSVIAERVERAAGPVDRLVGLLGRKSLLTGEGLWIEPCNGVHTWFMRFAIDLLVLDGEGRVLRVVTALPPWRLSMPVKGGRSVVELPAGTLSGCAIGPGDRVAWELLR
jgi:uncharacterized membrane protein (UPF0127 family)